MSSVKAITSRTTTPRLASRMANDRLKNIREDGTLDTEELLVDDDELHENLVENVDALDNTPSRKGLNPRVSFNATEMTLNLFKQYSKIVFFAERQLFSIHNPKINAKEKGNDKQVYIEFASGVFEALKKNMVRTLEDEFGITVVCQPKVEKYGTSKADSKVCLDMKMEVNNHVHFVKLCAYITNYGIDVAGMSKHQPMKARADHAPGKRFPHLENKTVGEYFAGNIIPKMIEKIGEKVDYNKVNHAVRKLARKALLEENGKKDCIICEKKLKDKTNFQCQFCCKLAHKVCATENTAKNAVALLTNIFTCKECLFKSPNDRENPEHNIALFEPEDCEELMQLNELTIIKDNKSQRSITATNENHSIEDIEETTIVQPISPAIVNNKEIQIDARECSKKLYFIIAINSIHVGGVGKLYQQN